jgi:conjugal transfer pilus assembly protein TrbC
MCKIIALLALLYLNQATAMPNVQVFVSFSMPDTLLIETLKDSARLNIPAYLNGLHHNSMQETAAKIMKLSQEVKGLSLQIDPTAFERFGITQVPALVVANSQNFDVIYGHLPLQEGLMRIAGSGQSNLTVDDVRRMIGE